MVDVKTETNLEALAERCEQAAGPDRPLSWDVWDAMGKPVVDDWSKAGSAPAYTASVDAALTLVPEGWVLSALTISEDRQRWSALMWIDDPWIDLRPNAPHEKSASCALAITAAALRAHAAKR